MAYFPFAAGRIASLGVLHGQGRDAVEFFTDKKVVIERWPKEWSRGSEALVRLIGTAKRVFTGTASRFTI